MTNRFVSPEQQFCDNTGTPYAGGFLYFYATGTSTPQNTYSDQALTVANTNPIVLDSNGYAGSVFLQNLAYKVVLKDSNSNQIWTMDPVYTSDYSTYAAVQAINGNPNGRLAGTAGTVGTLPPTSMAWDYTNNILYICTVTGNSATAVWTAVNASSTTGVINAPQGYLTLSPDPANPIVTTDITASTSVYYTPLVGNQIPVYNGTSFAVNTFSQLSLSLTNSQALNTLYDFFVFNNSGVLTLVTGPAWSVSTAGAGARGTGAGTTQLQRLNGLWVNAVQITGRNGVNSYTIPANTATYVGTGLIDPTAGQMSCFPLYGQSRRWSVWNAYNRSQINLQAGDGTASWTYTTNTIRPSNGNSANSVTTVVGLPEETQIARFVQSAQPGQGTVANQVWTQWNSGIGLNSTTAFASGLTGRGQFRLDAASADYVNVIQTIAQTNVLPTIGSNIFTCLETTTFLNNSTMTYFGTSFNMLMTVNYRG